MGRSSHQLVWRRVAVSLTLASAIGLAGCQQKSAGLDGVDSMNTASTTPASYQETAALGKAWKADPANVKKGIAYASGLEAVGQTDQQLAVLRKLYETNPSQPQLASLYGKKLLAGGQASEALPVLESAAAGSTDWRVHSALGSAYDQQGLYDDARKSYQKALTLDANNLSVLNNLGMSYALQGNLKEAEKVLRQANGMPKAASQPRIRQNLALVVGLQGRFEEASDIASRDLPPDQVEENMAYLKKMLSQPNTWQQLSESGEG